MTFREQNRSFPGSQREQQSSSTNSGTTESRSGATTIERRHWRGKSHKLASRSKPVQFECAVELVAGQARTLMAALEHRVGIRVPPDARILIGWWNLLRTR